MKPISYLSLNTLSNISKHNSVTKYRSNLKEAYILQVIPVSHEMSTDNLSLSKYLMSWPGEIGHGDLHSEKRESKD